MKKTGIRMMLTVLFLSMLTVFGQIPDNHNVLEAKTTKKIEISKKKAVVKVGSKITIKMKNIGNKKVTWTVDHKKVVSVKISGAKIIVTGKKAGTAKIKAKVDKKSYICKITVKNKKKSKSQETVVSHEANEQTEHAEEEFEEEKSEEETSVIPPAPQEDPWYFGDRTLNMEVGERLDIFADAKVSAVSSDIRILDAKRADDTAIRLTAKAAGSCIVIFTRGTEEHVWNITVNEAESEL